MAINREYLDANHAELVAAIRAEGHAEGLAAGRAEGASAERARIQAVEAAALPGCETLVTALKYDGVTTAEQAALKFNAHYKGINAGALANMEKDAAALPNVPAAPSPSGDPAAAADANKAIDERCKAKWDNDPKLRSEFSSYDNYLAYTKAVEGGKVKILGGRK